MHRLGDGAVGGVALAAGAQLDQVHRLARVEVEDVADPEGEAERVRRELVEPGRGESLVLALGDLQRPLEFAADARFARPPRGCRRRGRGRAAATARSASGGAGGRGRRRSRRRSRSGSGAPRSRARDGGGGCRARRRWRRGSAPRSSSPSASTAARTSGSGTAAASNRQRGEQVDFAPSTWSRSTAGAGSASSRRPRPSRSTHRSVARAARLQVVDPLAAAVGPLDPRDEARHHLLQLGEDHRAELARLGQRRGHQPQDQLLVGLAGGVDADVAEGRGGEEPAQEVERLGADRAPPRRLGLAVAARPALAPPTPRPCRASASR